MITRYGQGVDRGIEYGDHSNAVVPDLQGDLDLRHGFTNQSSLGFREEDKENTVRELIMMKTMRRSQCMGGSFYMYVD